MKSKWQECVREESNFCSTFIGSVSEGLEIKLTKHKLATEKKGLIYVRCTFMKECSVMSDSEGWLDWNLGLMYPTQ